ncbi:MAG: pyridoxine 5'-phosphate synthase [Bacteroidetes bacterium]|nr:pyridoxine 5'-phosphate synthase [Bacteroidota bacterium]
MGTKLSVNINKIATLRNSRGGNIPDPIQVAIDCERFGADGITVHPRPDERHIRYADVYELRKVVTTELNIEGNPREQSFVDLVLAVRPEQVTLVPDDTAQLTSDHGWDIVRNFTFLENTIAIFKQANIRVSIFVDAQEAMMLEAAKTGTDRIELYTENYAKTYTSNKENAVAQYARAARAAKAVGLGVNAGHDLNLDNLKFFSESVPALDEVSIGHALISDALYYGLENTIQLYKRCLSK